MTQENVENVRRAYEALQADGIESFLSYVDPEVEWHSLILEIEGVFRGHDGVREWWAELRSVFPDWRPSILDVQGFGDHVVAHGRGVGSGPASGIGVGEDYWQVAKIKEGRIVWHRAVRSKQEALEAAGLGSSDVAGLHEERPISSGVIDQLLEHAAGYGADHERGYHATDKSASPGRGLAIVACMDSRLRLFSLLGLDEGDAHVIRNAGGVVTDDTIRSLSVSQHLLKTVDVMVIQHTDCGLQKSTDADFDSMMRRHAGRRPSWGLRAITDLEASVCESVKAIEESPFLVHRGEVRGFIFDVTTGDLREVVGSVK